MKEEQGNVPVENTSTNQQVAQQSPSGATTNQKQYDHQFHRHLPAGETLYCLTLGKEEIYGVTHAQLEYLCRIPYHLPEAGGSTGKSGNEFFIFIIFIHHCLTL